MNWRMKRYQQVVHMQGHCSITFRGTQAHVLSQYEEAIQTNEGLLVQVQLLESALQALSKESCAKHATDVTDGSLALPVPSSDQGTQCTPSATEDDLPPHSQVGGSPPVPISEAEPVCRTALGEIQPFRRKLLDAELYKQQHKATKHFLEAYEKYALQQLVNRGKHLAHQKETSPSHCMSAVAVVNVVDQNDIPLVNQLVW